MATFTRSRALWVAIPLAGAAALTWFTAVPLLFDLRVTLDRLPDGDPVAVTGQATPGSEVELVVNRLSHGTQVADRGGRFEFPDISLQYGTTLLEARARATVLGRRLEDVHSVEVTHTPDPPFIHALTDVVNRPTVVVRGFTTPGATIVVSTKERSFDTQAGADGSFRTPVELPGEPGVYEISAQARRRRGAAGPSSDPIAVTYDPDAESSVLQPWRKITISSGYRDFNVGLEITLSKNDAWGLALLDGRGLFVDFLAITFPQWWIGREMLPRFFEGVKPDISLSDDAVTIRASSHPVSHRWPIVSAWGGTIDIARRSSGGPFVLDTFPLDLDSDLLTLTIRDYQIAAIEPLPLSLDKGTATWPGPMGTANAARPDGKISVRLTYDLWKDPARILTLTPFDLATRLRPFWLAVLAGVSAIAFLIPLGWLSWLARGESNRTGVLVQSLLTLVLIMPVGVLSQMLSDISGRSLWTGTRPAPVPGWAVDGVVLLVGGSATVALAGLVFVVVASASRRWRWLSWLRPLVLAALLAATIVIAVEVAAFILNAVTVRGQWAALASPALVGLLTLWVWRQNATAPMPQMRTLVTGAMILFVFALTQMTLPLMPPDMPPTRMVTLTFLTSLVSLTWLLPLLLLVGVLPVLKRLHETDIDRLIAYGTFFGAVYLVGIGPTWFMIPVPFVLAVWLLPRFVFVPPTRAAAIAAVSPSIVANRRQLLDWAVWVATAKEFKDSVEQLTKKLATGELSVAEFTSRRSFIVRYVKDIEHGSKVVEDVSIRDVVLAVGPERTNWDNGRRALFAGALLALPSWVLSTALFATQIYGPTAYVFGILVGELVGGITTWLLAAFFFGYFFAMLQGRTGLRKGLRVATVVIVCLLPVWLASVGSRTDLAAVSLRVGQTFLFFTVLGLWAFDYRVFRRTLGPELRFKRFLQFEDFPSLTAFASVLVASAGVAVNSIVAGQTKVVAGMLAKLLVPQLPELPLK